MDILELQALLIQHLRYQNYPPLPAELIVQTALEAIGACRDGEWEQEIGLPEGLVYSGKATIQAGTCIREWNLHGFLEEPEEV